MFWIGRLLAHYGVRAGKIRPVLDRAFPLSEAAEAHRLIASNKVAGNLALLPWAD